jgi:diguanylate cyclase (GGDEF)-like protein
MGARPLRRHPALPASIALVVVLGLGGLWAGHQAGGKAEQTHRADRLSLQQTLAGLTAQYPQVGAAEMQSILGAEDRAGVARWSGAGGNVADAHRLEQAATGSRALGAGAVLVVAPGAVAASYVPAGHVLPAVTDPGWAPLRAALKGGRGVAPVSGVLRAGSVPVIAVAVPVSLRSGATGLVVGLSELRDGPLQRYVAGLPKSDGRKGYAVDGRGLVIAAPSAAEIGAPLRWAAVRREVTRGGDGIRDVQEGGTTYTTSYARAGDTGWVALTMQDTEQFAGPLRRSARGAEAATVLLLLVAGALLLVLHRNRERALRDAALSDELTGLLNRRGWFAVASHEIERARRAGESRGLLFIDLDGLKQINDALGHREGDRAIADAADLLRRCARSSDVLGRLGGDEFVLLLGETGDPDIVRGRVLSALQQHNSASAARFELRMSVGAELWDGDDSGTLDDLVQRADERMYADKEANPERNQGLVRT